MQNTKLPVDSFDARMKKEQIVLTKDEKSGIIGRFALAVPKFNGNTLPVKSAMLAELLSVGPANAYNLGCMVQMINAVPFDALGLDTNGVVGWKAMIEAIKAKLQPVVEKCDKAAKKEAESNLKVAKK